MKKVVTLVVLCTMGFSVMAQTMEPTEAMKKEFRTSIQKRDISQRHLESNIPLANKSAMSTKGDMPTALPEDRVWFPGEWEEVRAIVVTPYYSYIPTLDYGYGYFIADPLVSGWASIMKYTNTGWQDYGVGPYRPVMDTTSTFGDVSFYLMDAIQQGGAEAWVRVEVWADSNKVLRKLKRMNLRTENVKFICGPGNSFWYRDCGPICFYYGDQDSVAMLDFGYYPGRALDDSLPTIIHQQMNIPNYHTPIEWEGGNCVVDGVGMVMSSDALYGNNTDQYGQITWDGVDYNSIQYTYKNPLTKAQTRNALHDLLGQRATYILPAYRYDGGTGHVDLYADMWDENGFVFSVMPDKYSSWTDYKTGAKNIDSLCSYKSFFDREYYIMGDIPFPSANGGADYTSQVQYNQQYTRTYSNHTFVNNLIIQPCFSDVVNGQPSAAWDRENLEALKSAYPGYTIYPVNVSEFDGTGGAIHCITKQIPADNPVRILHKNLHDTLAIGDLEAIPVSAVITNRSGIAHAEAIYREKGSTVWDTIELQANENRFYGALPLSDADVTEYSYEYYISATSNNGKTITKPMTANQGGYYSFVYTKGGTVDSVQFDFDTTAVDKEDITFKFSTSWTSEDHAPAVSIVQADAEQAFGQFYPNPATSQANMQIDLADGANYSVAIVDLSGRTVHTSHLNAAGNILYTINTSYLASGSYLVVFQNNDTRIVRKLIVK